jgi:hypothetical protein
MITLLALVFLATAQNVSAQAIGFLTTWENENEKIEVYKSVTVDVDEVKTYDASGKLLKFKNKLVKSLSAEGHEFRSMRVNSVQTRQLVEIVATSGKYLLATYFSTARYWLIFDLQGNTVVKQTGYNFATGLKKSTLEKIKPYFGDCAGLMEKMETNLNIKGNQLFDDVVNYECQ